MDTIKDRFRHRFADWKKPSGGNEPYLQKAVRDAGNMCYVTMMGKKIKCIEGCIFAFFAERKQI